MASRLADMLFCAISSCRVSTRSLSPVIVEAFISGARHMRSYEAASTAFQVDKPCAALAAQYVRVDEEQPGYLPTCAWRLGDAFLSPAEQNRNAQPFCLSSHVRVQQLCGVCAERGWKGGVAGCTIERKTSIHTMRWPLQLLAA